MIPRSWLPHVRAPIGKILVKREPVQSFKDGLWKPDSYTGNVRTATGFIFDIHKDVPRGIGYDLGDYVALSPGGGIQLVFGLAADQEHELWLFGANSVKAVFEEVPEKFEDHGEDVLRNAAKIEAEKNERHHWIEGQREGLR